MPRIVYHKEKSNKILGGGGPRDRQARLKLMQEQEMLRKLVPSVHAEVGEAAKQKEAPAPQVDLSQYLPFDVVRAKIEDAVKATRDSERERYESGLRNLNDQLKEARKKATLAEEQLFNANAEIRKLKSELSETPVSSADDLIKLKAQEAEITKLNAELKAQNITIEFLQKDLKNKSEGLDKIYRSSIEDLKSKESEIAELKQRLQGAEVSKTNMETLEQKLDKLYTKISDGSIGYLVGSKMDRPALEDKIFIDPIDKDQEPKLESHIEVKKDEVTTVDRDVSSDLAKLRNLLKL